ncbi:MAG: hypothetical protein ABUL64_02760 [Singulisphaera sp.]
MMLRAVGLIVFALACLTVVSMAAEPKKFAGNTPEVIHPAGDGVLTLPASKCEVHGKTLEYMAEDRALGWWNSPDDHAVWKLADLKPGKYEVWFEWSCAEKSAGNTFVVVVGKHELKGKIPSTGSWQTHKKANFGVIELPAGEAHLDLRSEGKIKEALGDFREVRLVPVKAK